MAKATLNSTKEYNKTPDSVNTPPLTEVKQLRFVPELNIAALKQKLDKELLFWYCLRAADVSGQGFITVEKARDILTKYFSYNSRRFDRHLKASIGKVGFTYQDYGRRTTIKIYALKEVCAALSINHITRFVDIDRDQVKKTSRRALFWNTGAYRPFGTGRVNHPISRPSLEEKTGIGKRQQIRYDHAACTIKAETMEKARDPVTHKVFQKVLWVRGTGGKSVPVKKQKGNRYYSNATQSRRGMTKKINQLAKGQQGSFVGAEATHKLPMPDRCFYNRFKDWLDQFMEGKAPPTGCYYPLVSNEGVYVECVGL